MQRQGPASTARPATRQSLPVSLAEIARLELSDAAQAAQLRHIDLGLAPGGNNDLGLPPHRHGDPALASADDAQILGHHDALSILVRNLLDNARSRTV